ncbi:electron transfer flavoprotein subunit beta/FixA family protein [Flavicella sp.]|uniref:electron transfer flavoprotein subunit beta/FixA family protein n=1 Tax=Flavicella sp. TaxID=2957742 RepID=UPI00262A1EF7|nr:electron transfer flavoprotein subunit beta/FixA family protein [Flavicella sp.]MDG1804790.1 electron transfer flavoprotein subunit beta/FixA family protein [Flavicella sp.]MDG2279636.1 electron transfer flavoprotein subunit beta/FixA family protein [Flavicella sp.]
MKILVCISHVPDTTSKINFSADGAEFDTNGVQYVINPYDEFSLARAMWFKEKQGASVTVITVGDASTEPSLRKSLAIGADDAIRIDAEATDGFAVAKQLAEVIKGNSYDLILMGRESIDYNGAMVPGILSTLIDFNFINACVGLEIEGTAATATKEIDGGTESLSSSLPLVVAGQKGLVEEKDLRIPNMRGIMMARKKPLAVVASNNAEALTKAVKFDKPEEKSACKMVDAGAIDDLIDLLHNDAKVI